MTNFKSFFILIEKRFNLDIDYFKKSGIVKSILERWLSG